MKKNGYIDKYYSNRNNIGACKNMLAAQSRCIGRFIWILCDDDLPCEGAIKEILEIIKNHSDDLSFIFLNNIRYFESGKLKRGPLYPSSQSGIRKANEIINLIRDDLIGASYLIVDRKAFNGELTKIFSKSNINYYNSCMPLSLSLDALSINGAGFLTAQPLLKQITGDYANWTENWIKIWLIFIPMVFVRSADIYGYNINYLSPRILNYKKIISIFYFLRNPNFNDVKLVDWIWFINNILLRPINIIKLFTVFLTFFPKKLINKFRKLRFL